MKREMSIGSGLSVIEGKWNKTNTSIKGLFDVLMDIHFENPNAYHYEMFCDSSSLKNILKRVGQDSSVKFLYLGAHGSETAIQGHGGDVSRTVLRNSLKALRKGSLAGLFIGSCLFGNKNNASFFLYPENRDLESPIKWVAGYSESIDWVASSALDILFWNIFFRYKELPPVERIKTTAEEIKKSCHPLAKELGFKIFIRKKKVREPIDLME